MLRREQLQKRNCVLPLMADGNYNIDEWLDEEGEENNNILLLVGTKNFTEIISIVCTSADELVQASNDRDRSKYRCTTDRLGSLQKNKFYVPFSYGLEIAQIGYLSDSNVKMILGSVYTDQSRIFKIEFVDTIAYTASLAVGDNDQDVSWVSANHCQNGSSILLYKATKSGIYEAIKAQRKQLLDTTSYENIMTLCGSNDNMRKLCKRDKEINSHILSLETRLKFQSERAIFYIDTDQELIIYDKTNQESLMLGDVENSGNIIIDPKSLIVAATNSRIFEQTSYTDGIQLIKNFNKIPYYTKKEPGHIYGPVITLNTKINIVTYLSRNGQEILYNILDLDTKSTFSTIIDETGAESWVPLYNTNNDCDVMALYEKIIIINMYDAKKIFSDADTPMNIINIPMAEDTIILSISSKKFSDTDHKTIFFVSLNYTNVSGIIYLYNLNKKMDTKLTLSSPAQKLFIYAPDKFVYATYEEIAVVSMDTMNVLKTVTKLPNIDIYYLSVYKEHILTSKDDKISVYSINPSRRFPVNYNKIEEALLVFSTEDIINQLIQ